MARTSDWSCRWGDVLQSGVVTRAGNIAPQSAALRALRSHGEPEPVTVTLETLGREWFTECGMAALLLLALVTSGVAASQVRDLLRHRSEPASPIGRRTAFLWPVMTVALALIFWLLLVAVWLFQSLWGGRGAPWW